MKAYPLTRHGRPTVLIIQDMSKPTPGPGQVRVKIETIGINYAEVLSRKGLYGWAPKLPYVLGMEAFGTIDSVGKGVPEARVGERVIVGAQRGAYAEYIAVPEVQALPAPDGFSAEENAAFAVNYLTAWVCLMEMARLRPTDTVLIQAAAGGVGTAAVQLAKKFGCTVYGTAGTDEKVALVKKLGADDAINYRTQDFEAVIKERTQGHGVDVVLEVIGGEVYRKSLRVLRPMGRIVVAGFASLDLKKWNPVSWYQTWRALPKADLRTLAERSHAFAASHIGYLLADPERMQSIVSDLRAFVERHSIRPVVGRVFDFSEIPAAHHFMESRQSHGKLVIRVRD